ncbi:MAG: hypothetical protein JF599_11920 [Verrucomicrobia bacterium]|nr:hypothetical protein [Verrucomicrobiota bacterium]
MKKSVSPLSLNHSAPLRIRLMAGILLSAELFATIPVPLYAVGTTPDASLAAPVLTPANVTVAVGLRDLQPFQAPSLAFSTNPMDLELQAARIFTEPLVPGTSTPVQGENAALAAALVAFKGAQNPEDISSLVQFIQAFPQSRWIASLDLNIGLLRYQTGYFSQALSYWASAWSLSRNETSDALKAVADRAFAEWAVLSAKLGHFAELTEAFANVQDREFSGSSAEKIKAAKEGVGLMLNRPDIAFKCGPYAINSLLNIGKAVEGRAPEVVGTPSTQQGTSLAQVQALADQVHLNYQAAKRQPGSDFIVPAVVHWKVGHFGAITMKKNDRYLIQDPTFAGGDIWVSAQALEAESSGYFLIPQGTLPAGWQAVSVDEAGTVWGKGGANTRGEEGKAPTCPRGMAEASIYPMRATLTIGDTPIFYNPPVGPAMEFALRYSHLASNQPAQFTFSNFGPDWVFNWQSYLTVDASQNITVAVRTGGSEVYNYSVMDNVNNVYLPNLTSQAVVAIVNGTYERRLPDGSKEVFNQADGTGRFFLTQVVDAQGNSVFIHYDASFRITYILDALNQQTTLTYASSAVGSAGFYKITRITDPFGRSAQFTYDSTFTNLITITDVVGITSQFTYDKGTFIDSLTTPYGRTLFYQYVPTADHTGTARGLKIVSADGSQQILENWIDHTLNTYYWDRKVVQYYPDTSKAQVTHWLLNAHSNVESPVPQYIQKPLENPIYYGYPSQPAAVPANDKGDAPGEVHYYVGVSDRPSGVDRTLDDGTHQIYRYQYNDFGLVTKSVDPVGRTISYRYAANGIDLLEVRGANNDLLGKWTYNAQHLPLVHIDGSGQTTTYTYNALGQLLTVTDPAGTTTLTYNAGGYLTRIDGPLAGANDVTTFTYDGYGRIRTVTDSENYTVRSDYDTLNRPTKITYPDGTYEQVTWDKLDPVLLRDRLGRWTQHSYDARRQMIAETDPQGRTTRYGWCGCGSIDAITDANGRKTQWTMDLEGRPIRKTFADGKAITYAYEATASRLKSTTDALGQTTNYTYNTDDSLKQVSYANALRPTSTINYTYEAAYPRVSTVQNDWGTLGYTYNAYINDPFGTPVSGGGRLQKITNTAWANSDITYAYDATGRVASRSINGAANTLAWAYDAMGRVTSVTNPLGQFNYAYVDPAYGTTRLSTISYPNGQSAVFSWFNNAGDQRLGQITNLTPAAVTLSGSSYAYDAVGRIMQWTQQADAAAPVRLDLGYDNADQLTSAVASNATTNTILKRQYFNYDAGGNRKGWQVDGAAQQTSYNSVNQVVGTTGGGAVQVQGTLDEVGTVTVNGTPATMTTTKSFNAAPVLNTGVNTIAVSAKDGSGNTTTNTYQVAVGGLGAEATPIYDANGNLTDDGQGQTYEWDAANRLLAINHGTHRSEFSYDGLGRRVQIIEKSGSSVEATRRHLWVGVEIAEERDAGNVVIKRFYAQGVQVPGAAAPADKLFYNRDHLGSVRELTDNTGALRARYDYDPYGRVTKVSGDLDADFGFTGHFYHPASGLNLTLYRAYDPNAGRWLSRDPIAEAGGLNLYGYVTNDPFNLVDPLGLSGGNGSSTTRPASSGVSIGQSLVGFAGYEAGVLGGSAIALAAPQLAIPLAIRFPWLFPSLLGAGKVLSDSGPCPLTQTEKLASQLEKLGGGIPRFVPTPKGAPQFIFPNGMVLRFDLKPGQFLKGQGPHINLEIPGNTPPNIHIPVKE